MAIFELVTSTDHVTIDSRGAVIRRWVTANRPVSGWDFVPDLGPGQSYRDGDLRAVDVIDGYVDDAELEALSGCRSNVLAPWANRIRDARYSFAGKDYDFGPDADGIRQANHGLVMTSDFRLVSRDLTAVTLATRIANHPQYPHDIALEVRYRLVPNRLETTVTARNCGTDPAPVALGLHPYFYYRADDCHGATLDLPATHWVRTDAQLFPLPGAAAFAPVASAPGQPDTATTEGGVTLRELRGLDTAFTGLRAAGEGWICAQLNQANSDRVRVCLQPGGAGVAQQHGPLGVGVIQVFSGEPLPSRAGRAIAIEPCQMMADTFNREECDVTLAPGAQTRLEAAYSYQFSS